jgi:hypothetical protein
MGLAFGNEFNLADPVFVVRPMLLVGITPFSKLQLIKPFGICLTSYKGASFGIDIMA